MSTSDDLLLEASTELSIQHFVTDSHNVFAFDVADAMTQETGSVISVTEPTKSNVTLDAYEFVTDGTLSLGVLDSSSTFNLLETSSNAAVTFTPAYQSFLSGITIKLGGSVTVADLMDLSDVTVLEISEGGVLQMSGSGNPIMLKASNTLRVNGQFLPPVQVDFDSGSPDFFVGASGRFEFDDASNFVADRLQVDGVMKCASPISFDGRSNIKLENLVVSAGGERSTITRIQQSDFDITCTCILRVILYS